MPGLPPLAAVRAFEAAARHLSFTRAAEELGATQAAVSYQIRLLEERLGMRLFRRMPRQVVLTEAGERLAPAVTGAFDSLRAAFAAVHDNAGGVLSITAATTFAANWLVPRLGEFQMAQPRIAVRLDTSSRVVDFAREEFDLAIRIGTGDWPGLTAHLLMPIEYTPMCSPALLAQVEALAAPADLLRLPLVSPSDAWWRRWFALAGVTDPDLSDRTDTQLGSQALEVTAAIAGQGVAIATPAFAAADLAAGRLVQPFDLVCREEKGYWLVYPDGRGRSAKVRAFRDWLLQAAGQLPV